jgi:DNA topoisomerase-1
MNNREAAITEIEGLHYVNDNGPGISRRRSGKGFSYRDSTGRTISDEAELARIAALGIPPAWTHVWICPDALGHIQATGRDVKGRKQYRYHPRWREVRDIVKYDRMITFGKALPLIRERVEHDLARRGLPREKVLATVVRLLETTLIRVGNREYARQNRSFGLTTLRDRHVKVRGTQLSFTFRGKSGKDHQISITDRRLARIVKQCQDVPGYELFQYLDEEGERHHINSDDVNTYLREISGEEFSAKDFRTWAGTVLTMQALAELGPCASQREIKGYLNEAIKHTAARLGNTAAISRKSYIHPALIASHNAGSLLKQLEALRAQARAQCPAQLEADESLLLHWLETQ